LLEFERYVRLKGLVPLIVVEYRREGFIARGQHLLRLTFDHQICCARADSLFPPAPFFRALRRGAIIFEIKCDKSQPAWLRALVQAHGLRIMANSKFAQGIESARPELVQPGWSI
jgi:SPX domain protein involved in polyphosphate accumulation